MGEACTVFFDRAEQPGTAEARAADLLIGPLRFDGWTQAEQEIGAPGSERATDRPGASGRYWARPVPLQAGQTAGA